MTRRAQRRVLERALVTLFAGVLLMLAAMTGAPDAANAASGASSWTVYHGNVAGSGVSTALRAVNTTKRAWSSPALQGQLYGEPLVFGGALFVATQDNLVYALSSSNGSILWARRLARAVPSSNLPCSNISPFVGITGTPVIDPSRKEIFVVADELVGGKPQHRLVGLSTTSGAVELNQRVDPPGSDPAALLQRTGLTLDAGHVVFGYGGNYGDCATYQGRVVSVKETGSTPAFFTVDARAGQSQGAIWMGGAAPVIDARGNVWVSVGNGSVNSSGQVYDDSDSVLELSSALRLRQYFAPADWPQNNASDLDMSMAPALLANGQVVLAGKSGIAYLLNGAHLGGIGTQESSLANACSNNIDGGSAVVGLTVYLPCLSGTVAVRATSTPPTLTLLWSSSGGGPPIVAAGLVWTVGQDGVLYGLDPSSGHVRQQASIGTSANHFATPSVGDGLLLATSTNRVVAFRASASS